MWEEWLGHWCRWLNVVLDPGALPEQLSCESEQGTHWVIEKTDTQVVISLRFDALGYQLDQVVGLLMREITPARFAPLTLRYGYQNQIGLMLILVFSMARHGLNELHLGYNAFCEIEQRVEHVMQQGIINGD